MFIKIPGGTKMNPKSLIFQSQSLVVDYITFKFQDSQCDQNKIAIKT